MVKIQDELTRVSSQLDCEFPFLDSCGDSVKGGKSKTVEDVLPRVMTWHGYILPVLYRSVAGPDICL